ncbi:MAG: hypothetical protein FWD31_06785 [Planctomycetaceae bacterium]|nr:hypothetical protein [Planctomycetaceae bacterium]
MMQHFSSRLAVAFFHPLVLITVAGLPWLDSTFAQQSSPGNSRVLFGQSANSTAQTELRTGASSILNGQNSISTPSSSTAVSSRSGFVSSTSSTEYDPIAANGKYFEDWDTPQLAIVFTGGLDGYVEPCGCAGIDKMKGGLSRRSTFFKELRAKNWPYIAIENGGLVKGFGRQEELKFSSMIVPSIVDQMKYDAIGIGPNDLRLSGDTLLPYTTSSPDDPSVFTSANVGVFGFNPVLTAPYRVIEKHGVRIGVTSIIGMSWQPNNVGNIGILLEDPIVRLKQIVPQMEKDRCDWMILISHASVEETLEISNVFPQFGIIVCADTPSEPPLITPKWVAESDPARYLIETGEKGKFAIVIGFFGPDYAKVKYQRVAFDSRYDNDKLIVEQMQYYQINLRDELETKGYGGFGIRPVPAPTASLLGKYVGSAKCEPCHDESHRIWRRSGHAGAWSSLAETSIPTRIYDPECVCCHVIGWNPEEKYPYINGFSNEKGNITLDLVNVGCENCHGPGEAHCAAEAGSNESDQERYRATMRLSTDEAGQRLCYTCHDLDNSPNFTFDEYWPKIKHQEKLSLEDE